MPPNQTPHITQTTRERLLNAMMNALSTRGFHGVGLSEILSEADAPKGVLYHYFPGGKTELALAAIESGTEIMITRLTKSLGKKGELAVLIEKWFESSATLLSGEHFERGCLLATVALETTADDEQLRAALADSFARIRSCLEDCLVSHGYSPEQSQSLASLIVSAYEGALIQARVAHDPSPLRQAARAMAPLLQ